MPALETVIRPAAVLPDRAAQDILGALANSDVRRGGVWNTTTTLWQRYDRPWDGALGSKGSAVLIGSLAVVYGTPTRASITVYRASISAEAAAAGWDTDQLCNEAFGYAGLTLANCPRAAAPAARARQTGVVSSTVPALVTLDVWGVPARAVPAALAHMALDRPA